MNKYLEEVKLVKRWTLERIADGKRLHKVPLQLMSTDESEVENSFIKHPIEIIDLPAVVPSMTEAAMEMHSPPFTSSSAFMSPPRVSTPQRPVEVCCLNYLQIVYKNN